jgi:hypothetical protein
LLDNLRFSDRRRPLVTVTDGAGHLLSGLTVAAYDGSTVTSNTGVTDSAGLAKVWVPQGSFLFGVTEAGVTTYSSPTNQCQVPGVCAADIIIVKCHNVVCTASDACHSVGLCQPSTGVCNNPTANLARPEAESSSPAVSSGDRQDVVADTAASNGKLDLATLNAVGDYVRYTVHIRAPGDYAVSVRTRQSGPRRDEGEYSTYLTEEQRRDATRVRDFTTGGKPFGALDPSSCPRASAAQLSSGRRLRKPSHP